MIRDWSATRRVVVQIPGYISQGPERNFTRSRDNSIKATANSGALSECDNCRGQCDVMDVIKIDETENDQNI